MVTGSFGPPPGHDTLPGRDRDQLAWLAERLAPVPPGRLGHLLARQRKVARLPVVAAAAAAGVSRHEYKDVEHGRLVASPTVVARLLDAFGITLAELLPPRVSIDAALLDGGDPAEILRSYIALVRKWRALKAGGPLRFRRDDIAVLVGLLGTDRATIERRLMEVAGCSRAEARRFRKYLLSSLAVALMSGAVGTIDAATAAAAPAVAAAASGVSAPAATSLVGVLQPALQQAATIRAAGVNAVVVSARWDLLEPSPGVVDLAYVARLRSQLQAWQHSGIRTILDPGLQYPPSWVFGLDSSTRFVDQHGRAYVGSPGGDVPDAVWNLRVRAAQRAYLGRLNAAVSGVDVAAVRAGGLLYGELRLPGQGIGTNSFWAFSRAAQAASPVPGWRPGDPGKDRAAKFLNWYLGSMTNYERFLVSGLQASFPGVPVQVMFPNWGVRPGEAAAAIAKRLTGGTVAERNGTLSQGLAWDSQVAALPPGVMVYSTNLAAPDKGPGQVGQSPIAYLSELAKRRGLPVAGETAGPGDAAALRRVVSRAHAYGLTAVLYMNQGALFSGESGKASLADFGAAAKELRALPTAGG